MKDDDVVSSSIEGRNDVWSDEPGAADDQDAHAVQCSPRPLSAAAALSTFSGWPSSYAFRQYVAMEYIRSRILDRELKKGSAELLILSLVEDQPRHGYDLSKLIELRSRGVLAFRVASLYPLLYRLEKRGWIQGRWIEKAGQRRRRYYRLTPAGATVLRSQRSTWREFVAAINRIAGVERA
jgi:PadR family transcriptional regulator